MKRQKSAEAIVPERGRAEQQEADTVAISESGDERRNRKRTLEAG